MTIPETIQQEIHDHLERMDEKTQSLIQPFMDQPSLDSWIRDVLLAYYCYFLLVLIHEKPNKKAEQILLNQLRDLVPKPNRTNLNKIEDALSDQFKDRGYFFLGGYTQPYRGPYIWKRLERKEFVVELPDQEIKVGVFFMHDFLMRSWYHFKTYGVSGAGGWAKENNPPWEDGLYCVAECYDLECLEDDEKFQISLLKHEAQHYADKVSFPKLTSVNLEYRAKLVELSYYTSIESCFRYFIREANNNSSNPHEYASHRILKMLSRHVFEESYVKDEHRWEAIDYGIIKEKARQLLAENTQKLRTKTK